jgi:hypothetical protein
MGDSRIKVTITVTNKFDPKLYEHLLGAECSVEEAAAWEQAQYDDGTYDAIDLVSDDPESINVTFKGIKGDETRP